MGKDKKVLLYGKTLYRSEKGWMDGWKKFEIGFYNYSVSNPVRLQLDSSLFTIISTLFMLPHFSSKYFSEKENF